MWIFAALGMALFGISKEPLNPNQIHLLFAPVMAAYGLAFISILWSRLEVVIQPLPAQRPLLRGRRPVVRADGPVPAQPIKIGLDLRDHGGVPQWPPYLPSILNDSLDSGLKGRTKEDQIVVSDQPWAVAWYADRLSLWLPTEARGFEQLEDRATSLRRRSRAS